MAFIYDLGYIFGNFFLMIAFMIIAMLSGKSKSAWIWYFVGAVIQYMSLSGMEITASEQGTNTNMFWITYFVLLAVTAIVILIRYFKNRR